MVVRVPALPERGGDLLASQAEALPGGGFNVMAAAARQGLPVAYGGARGTGPFATVARQALAREGIAVILPPKASLDTGFVLAMVEPGGERTFLTSRGAEATLTTADLDLVRPAPRDAIYLSGYSLAHDSNRAAILGWLARLDDGHTVFFDPGPLAGSIPAEVLTAVLRRVDWLTCNAREAAILAGTPDPRAAAAVLAGRVGLPDWPGRSLVLVRVGPDGCLIGRRDAGIVHVPGFPVDVIDTNGAGDAHSGAFIAALAAGEDEVAAARSANAAAALSVTRRGPATAPTRKELASFLATVKETGGRGHFGHGSGSV